MSPVITGISIVPPFKLPTKPNSILWPGCILLFQDNPVAEYGLLPDRFAFHELATRFGPEYCHEMSQPLTGLAVELVKRILATNPVFHSLSLTYSQVADACCDNVAKVKLIPSIPITDFTPL